MCSSMFGFICWKTTSLHSIDLFGWLFNSNFVVLFLLCSVSSLLFSFLSHHFLQHCYVILFLFAFIFTFILFPFFFICSYLSVSVFILSLYHLILATILAPFCNFFFGVSFTQLLLWKRLMVHYHIQCGLYSVRRPYTNLLNFIVYYHNIAK